MATKRKTKPTRLKSTRKKTPARPTKKVKQKAVAVRAKSAKSSRTKVALPTAVKRNIPWPILVLVGIQLFFLGGWWLLYQQTILSFKVSPIVTAEAHLRGAQPTQITIASANISLPVTPATITEGIWQTSDVSATHLETSARPTEGGNIVVYGHNRRHLFGPLPQVKTGDVIKLTTDIGTTHDYFVHDIKVVDPSAIEEVLPTNQEVLTVYTCTGWLDSQRLVLKAYPSQVSSL